MYSSTLILNLLHRWPERQIRLTFSGRVLVVLDDTGQSKISDLTHQTLVDQDISSAEVSVNVVSLLDVSHAFCYLKPGKTIRFKFNEFVSLRARGQQVR